MGYIGRKAGTTILHAPRTANALGRPLNTFVTIRLWQLGSTEQTASGDFSRLLSEWFQRWSSRPTIKDGKADSPKNGKPTYIRAIENPTGRPHVHWTLHVDPANRERFVRSLEKRLRKQFGVPDLPLGVLDVRPVVNAEGIKKYVVKTLNPAYGKAWGIRTQDGGDIFGRRADSSRNLGPATWKPLKAAYRKGTERKVPPTSGT